MNKKPPIDLNNYEIFVIDYLDGKLTPSEEVELMNFLDQYPDLKEEVDGLGLATLEPIEISADFKQHLKKTPILQVGDINELNYDTCFIASYEHDLNELEKEQLTQFLALNPQLLEEYKLHGELFLQPDYSLVYHNKETLKKRRRIPVFTISAVAASLTILLAVTFFFKFNTSHDRPEVFLSSFAQRQVQQISSPHPKVEIDLKERTFDERPDLFPADVPYEESPDQPLTPVENKARMDRLLQKPISGNLVNDYSLAQLAAKPQPATIEEEITLLADASSETADRKSLFSKVIGGQWNKITRRFSRNKEQNIDRQLQGDEPGYIKLIDRSILVFNTVTGSETHVEKTYNNEGHLTDYKVSGNRVYVSRPVTSTQTP